MGALEQARARAAETAQRDCNEAEYGRRDTLSATDSALRDANAGCSSQPLTRILLEREWHLGVCVCTDSGDHCQVDAYKTIHV